MDDQPTKKLKAFKLQQELGTKSYNYCNIDQLETSIVEIGVMALNLIMLAKVSYEGLIREMN